MSRIGVFGGSFNPIHVGHIALARQLRQIAGLDEVWLMVSPQNPLKRNSALLDDQLRFEMAQVALGGEEGLVASDYELYLPRPSYTWNTLRHLSEDYPQHTFLLLIGGDNWAGFHHWYRANDIVRDYQIVVYPRRGSAIEREHLPANVTIAETELLDISSTEIRCRVSEKQSIRGMVPEAVEPLVWKYYENFSAKRFAVSEF